MTKHVLEFYQYRKFLLPGLPTNINFSSEINLENANFMSRNLLKIVRVLSKCDQNELNFSSSIIMFDFPWKNEWV